KSQSAFASAVGLTQSKYGRIENGTIKELPTPEDLRLIGDALGLSMEDMLRAAGYLTDEGEDTEKAGLEEFHARLDPLLVGLDEYDLDAVLDAATAMANASRRRRERTHGSPQPVDASG